MCICVYMLVLYVCVCVCVCLGCQLLFQAVSGLLTRLCSCSGQELSPAADLILLKRICVFVFVCVGQKRSVQEVALAIERDGWENVKSCCVHARVCGTILENRTGSLR